MPSKSKAKGNRFERLVVDMTKHFFSDNKGNNTIRVKRAWGSNGAAMGQHEEVDILIGDDIKLQAKCRGAMGQWMIPNENVDAQVIKADREDPLIVMKYDDWLEMLQWAILGGWNKYDKNE
tara:strand:- start:1136 stop:1498 length:363 start_codon:yes stop_codon:yes gene_type:complete